MLISLLPMPRSPAWWQSLALGSRASQWLKLSLGWFHAEWGQCLYHWIVLRTEGNNKCRVWTVLTHIGPPYKLTIITNHSNGMPPYFYRTQFAVLIIISISRLLIVFLKIDLLMICECTIAVFRHQKRHQIPWHMVTSHHVCAVFWTQDLQKSSRRS